MCPSLPNYKKLEGGGGLWCLPHRTAGKVYEVTKNKTLMAVGLLNYGHHDLMHPLQDGHPWGFCPSWVLRSSCPGPSPPSPGPGGAWPPHITRLFPTSRGSRQVGKWAGGQKWVRQDSREGFMNRNTPEYCGWGGEESEGER